MSSESIATPIATRGVFSSLLLSDCRCAQRREKRPEPALSLELFRGGPISESAAQCPGSFRPQGASRERARVCVVSTAHGPPPRSLRGDTEVAALLAIERCRAPAPRVIELVVPTLAVGVSYISNPFRRSHIFAVVGGMMVVSRDVAINGRASESSGATRAYPPWTKRPTSSAPDRVRVC